MYLPFLTADEDALIIGVPVGLLAWAIFLPLVPAIRDRSWKRYFRSFLCGLFAVFLPLFVFLYSVYLEPEWKGLSPFGWWGCMHVGKMMLVPPVLWACVAFCAVRVVRRSEPAIRG